MERSRSLPLAILAAVCLAVQLPTAHAEVVITDDVDPNEANDWNSNTSGYVGKTADCELNSKTSTVLPILSETAIKCGKSFR